MIEYRIAAAAAMLILASYFDLKSREIDDRLWVGFSLLGGALYVAEFLVAETISGLPITLSASLFVGAVIGLTVAIAYSLYYLGFYAGADALALVSLALVLPLYDPPVYGLPIYHSPIYLLLYPITSVMVLANAAAWVLALPVYFLLRNLSRLLRGNRIFTGFEDEPWWKKAVAVFLGYRLKAAKEGDFYLALEKRVKGKRRFDFRLIKEEDVEFLRGSDVWGTPGIPLLLFMTLGLFTMLLFGDLVTLFMDSLVSVLIA